MPRLEMLQEEVVVTRVWNFSAGPSVLPESVLQQAASELTDFDNCGHSVMEMSHRSAVFTGILERAEISLRTLLGVPETYRVLFLQGGAWTQFAMVPLNLFRRSHKADYLETGSWSTKAIGEARKFGTVRVVASGRDNGFTAVPDTDKLDWDPDADYAHITTNNTIYGTRLAHVPDTGAVPLVADMSSNFLSEPLDVSRFGIIYAGAQKNAGPAGLTLVIIREDLIGHAGESVPSMLDYAVQAKAGSLFNTPPCFAIYMAGLVFDQLVSQGGLTAVAAKNRAKADLLYGFLDRSSFFRATVAPADRSLMNVPFLLADEGMTEMFSREAAASGLINLKGHRSVGGCRASIYNAMPLEGVRALVAFMSDFETRMSGRSNC